MVKTLAVLVTFVRELRLCLEEAARESPDNDGWCAAIPPTRSMPGKAYTRILTLTRISADERAQVSLADGGNPSLARQALICSFKRANP